MKVSALAGRLLYSLIFIILGPRNFQAAAIAAGASHGVPLAKLLVPLAGLLALLGGLSLAVGYHARLGALALVVFLVPVTLVMHDFWAVSDPAMRQLQLVMFLKNVSMLGAALIFVSTGAGAYSLDMRAAARRDHPGETTTVPA